MSLRLAASLALLLAASPLPVQAPSGPGSAAAPQAGPVEGLVRAWLEAFNSGDRARIKAFYKQHADDPEPMFALEQAEDSCGLTVDRIAARSPTAMTIFFRQKCLPGLQRLKIEIASAEGTKTKTLDLRPMPLPGDEAIQTTAEIARRLATRDLFAGSLVIRRGNGTVMQRSWGLADPDRRVRMSGDTPMFLASAGKMFTAVAILQLVDSGKIELDAPLGKYLTDYPNADMAKVTIRQLLTHRGGTGDIGILARGDSANRAKVRTVADLIRLNGARAPAFPPGSKADYSNYGFVLLGAVIERVTGTAYHDHVRRAVFERAGMTRSGFPDRDHLAGVAIGYTNYFGAEPSLRPNLEILPWRGTPAGGGVSTPRDMLAFFAAMKAGRLLSPASFRLATSAGATSWYGMGFIVNTGEGASWGHGGTSYGMDIAAHHYSKIDTTFLCMAARDMVCNRLIFAWYLRTFAPED